MLEEREPSNDLRFASRVIRCFILKSISIFHDNDTSEESRLPASWSCSSLIVYSYIMLLLFLNCIFVLFG